MQAEDKSGTGEVELLPCPFCGGEATTDKHVISASERKWSVYCRNAQCDVCFVRLTEAEAITAWNTRHTPDVAQAVEAERARIVAALDELRKPAIFGAEEARRKNRYDLKREFNLIAEAYDKAIAIARGEEEGG